jgi:hypothetical protein
MSNSSEENSMPTPQAIKNTLDTVTAFLIKNLIDEKGWGMHQGKDKEVQTVATALAEIWLLRFDAAHHIDAIEKGSTALVNRHHQDGGWGDQAGQDTEPWSTALATYALIKYLQWADTQKKPKKPAQLNAARSGLNWLKIHVTSTYTTRKAGQLDAYPMYWTALALTESLLVSALSNTQIRTPMKPLAFNTLKSKQNTDGGWGEVLGGASGPGATAYIAYLLLTYGDERKGETVKRGVEWVAASYHGHDFQASPRIEPLGREIVRLLSWGIDPNMPFDIIRRGKDLQVTFDALGKGIDYLLASQKPGGWCDSAGESGEDELPDILTTQSALRALYAYLLRLNTLDSPPPLTPAPKEEKQQAQRTETGGLPDGGPRPSIG